MSDTKKLWTGAGAALGLALGVWAGSDLWPGAPYGVVFAIGFGAIWIGAGFGALIGMSDRG